MIPPTDVETDRAAGAPDATGRREAGRPMPGGLRALGAAVGGTPLLPLPSPRPDVRILGKAEWTNPGGSVKDRAAWTMVREAWREGRLPARRLLDASSGNTAIAYAMLGAAGGFGVTLCVPESASEERIRTLEAYGAELILTDPMEGSDGAIRRARELAAERPERFWYADQYGNPANPLAHRESTGPEVWRDTGGAVTHLVAGLGTTGTLVGAGSWLRERRPDVRLVGVEPATPLHGIEGLKHLETAIRPAIFDPELPDERRAVATERAQEAARRLARESGLFVGVSSGAAWTAAREVAAEAEARVPARPTATGAAAGDAGPAPVATVVVILPDGGGRYLSERWWTE